MSKDFILLTRNDNTPIIIGTSNIGVVEPDKEGSMVTLNFSRGSDLYPKTEWVKETFEEIKILVGLKIHDSDYD